MDFDFFLLFSWSDLLSSETGPLIFVEDPVCWFDADLKVRLLANFRISLVPLVAFASLSKSKLCTSFYKSDFCFNV